MQRHHSTSDSLCKYVRAETGGTVILSFSLGKDSVAAWIQLRRFFPHIVPYYLYLIPDLAFVNASLTYYEQVFKTSIIRAPHPSVYRMLNNLVFQAPENCRLIESMQLQEPSYDTLAAMVRRENKLPPAAMVATGVRCSDSIMRRTSLKKWGSLNPKRKTFWPVFDWTADRLETELRQANMKLPVDYHMFGRSFDGIDFRFLNPIKERFPEDYARILQFFPLADLELFRRESRLRHAR